ncbi:MAG: sulfite exporter TauE/SafE family protein [Bacteroidota bacterium]
MLSLLSEYSLSQWLAILLAAFIIGLSKAGLKGIDMMNVTIMALVFGGKTSTGVVLPLLCVADILAVWYYKRHVQWPHFRKLIPWMIVGILIGVFVGKEIDEVLFRRIMAIIIILTVIIMVYLETRRNPLVPKNMLFASTLGLASGFTTMLGNLAGAFANIYFLSMRMSKNDFIGTAAWIFLVVNLFKLPFQVFYWQNITAHTLQTDLVLLPAMLLGFFIGLKCVALIKDDGYRKVIMVLTMAGALVIFLK